jgi:Xaa-Pro aminopeptidase
MKYKAISNKLYLKNRQKLYKKLMPGSLVVLNSNDFMPTNGDGLMPFRQNSDLLYLSGIDQEETIFLLFPDAHREDQREMLFLKKTSNKIEIWEGHKYTREEAIEASGVKNIFWLDEFEKMYRTAMAEAEHVYLNSNEHIRAVTTVQTRDDRFRDWTNKEYPLHDYKRLTPFMHQLRSVKEPEEIETIRQACTITRDAFIEICKFVEPGVTEYEIEALFQYEILKRRATGPAYGSIIASGFSACVLHYVDNNKACNDGEVILMDIGAEYANYASDLSRCIPVNGRFTKRQKEVYNAVLQVQKSATKLLKTGVFMDDYHKQVGDLMEEQLVGLALITMDDIKKQDPAWPAYKKYFMHGTSHFLGLDVHDIGLWTEPIKEGMVFTVEPGIYIPEESLGIRIENDIVVQKDSQNDLMFDIPREVEEIEEVMNS